MLGMETERPPATDSALAAVEILSTLSQLGELSRLSRLTIGGVCIELDASPGVRRRPPQRPAEQQERPDPVEHLLPPTELYDDSI